MLEKLSLPISIVLAGILIGGGFYLNTKVDRESSSSKNQISSSEISNILRPIDANDHILGNPEARVVIVEYSDTECPFCKVFHVTMNTIMKEYGASGKVAWVYRHFPIEELHKKAKKEAEAQECVAELGGNGKFWEYTNKIYETTPSNDGLDPKELTNIAVKIGIPSAPFNTCLESGQYAPRVSKDIENAQALGALGTPYSILIDQKNDEYYVLEGHYPYDQLKTTIELVLQN